MHAVLEVINLKKTFGKLEAVRGLNFSVSAGMCLGLLGPNGAGKTTTVEMMEGILTPSSGEVLYQGKPFGEAFRQEAGIMFQTTALQQFISCYEILKMFHRLYNQPVPLRQIIEECQLHDILSQDAQKISGGQKQRLLLGIALLNDPNILFLDEPTTGLDPQARRNLWDRVERIKRRNKTVILTTHYMEEAYRLCDSIIIIDKGNIIAQGTPTELLRKHFGDKALILPLSAVEKEQESFLAIGGLIMQDEAQLLTRNVNNTLSELLHLGIPLDHLYIRERNLEDLFLELTGKEIRL